MASDEKSGGGIGFFGMLAILFIGLKLAGFIDWPWALVLAPIWAPVVAFVVAAAFVLAAAAFPEAWRAWKEAWKDRR